MPFVLLIFRNLIRQKVRTGLTVLGISIGITAVVALGIITESAKASTLELLQAGGNDFAIGRQGSADLTFSTLTVADLEKVTEYPEVTHATGVLLAFTKVGSNPYFTQVGIDPADLTRALGRVPEHHVRSEGAVVVPANNQGVPFVLSNPGAGVSQDVERIAAELLGVGRAVAVGAR